MQLIHGEEPKIAEAEEFDELDQTDVLLSAPSASVDEDDEDFKIEEI